MKIKVVSKGETEFAADDEYTEPAIREALELAAAGAADVGSPRVVENVIIDYTDTERSDIDHDQHATVTEDDGTVLWSGWLSGGMEDEPVPDADDPVQRLLDLPLPANDSHTSTVRGYLTQLLLKVWREEEGFNGKRPFGNSSWQYDIYVPMVEAGMISGKLDEDGYVETLDERAADALILAAIEAMGRQP